MVILLSDGEDQEQGAVEMARKLKESGTRLYAVGVGTQKGGPIPIRDDAGNRIGFKHDRKNQVVVSTFQPDALIALAAAGGGRYWNASTEETELDDLLRDLGGLNRTDYSERRFLVYEERFQWPLALAILFLLLELSLPARRLRRARGAAPAVAALLLLVLGPPSAEARQPQVGAYLENEKGLKEFGEGNLEEARKHVGSAQALDPSLPELDYNRGVIQLQEGDMDGAIEAFGKAAGEPALAGRSQYNRGIAFGKKNDFSKAVRSYMEAIDTARRDHDETLEADARKNIELLMREREQQKKESDQQKKDGQSDPNQKQKEGDQEKEKKDQNGGNPKPDKPKQFADDDPKQQRKNFKSQKLNRDDAERVMSQLNNKDRELQTRMNRQNGTPQNVQNDW